MATEFQSTLRAGTAEIAISPSNAWVLGVPITKHPIETVLHEMGRRIETREQGSIGITNTESIYFATKLADHREYIRNTVFSCCDGVGVVWAARMAGERVPRIHGPDLMLRACEFGVPRGWRHYFYGGRDGVAETLSQRLTARFPGMITAGTYCPPFRALSDAEDNGIIESINGSKPDIIWVGLGLLKQERWVAAHLGKVDAPWLIGVGAAFDFHAGTAKRAPKLFREAGFEWAYRLVLEPRMFTRNMRSIPFLMMAARNAVSIRLGGGKVDQTYRNRE